MVKGRDKTVGMSRNDMEAELFGDDFEALFVLFFVAEIAE